MSYQITLTTTLQDSDDEQTLEQWLTDEITEPVIFLDRWAVYCRDAELYQTTSLHLLLYLDWTADIQSAVDTLSAKFEGREWCLIESQRSYREYREPEWRDAPDHYPPDMTDGLRTDPSFDCPDSNSLCVSAFDYRHNDTNKSVDKQTLTVEPVDNWRTGVVTVGDELEMVPSEPVPNTDMLSDPTISDSKIRVGTVRIPPNERELGRLRPETQYQPPEQSNTEYKSGSIPDSIL
ncbi:hypothetical protein OSG_eHP1_00130 [environmental Halophage eHP-1]|nr:hypothetical protein OSG_eHP1_00130 [environmental Halophage eHP-1]